jgi:hypothetical protein
VIRPLIAATLSLMLAACEDPSDYLPKQAVAAEKPPMPRAEATELVRAIVSPCERAMDRASGAISAMAASNTAPASAREPVAEIKTACAGAFDKLQGSAASGEVRDACLTAVYARESVADTAITILDGRATPLTPSTLQYKAADQAAASRACVSALSQAG